MTQPAVVNFAPEKGSVELREIPRPEIGPEDVLLEVAAAGVCGSDLHQWTGDHSWPVNYPVVLGHEFAGVVCAAGDRAGRWAPGTRAVSETAAVIDPASPMSRAGLYNLDPSRLGFGYGVDGAMTRWVRVPARCLHHVPDPLPLEKAALAEPCCVAYSTVAVNATVRPGDRIVVFGPGPIGLLCGAIARLRGAEVAVVGLARDRARLEIAKQYGCTPISLGADVATDDRPSLGAAARGGGLHGEIEDWARSGDGLGADGVIDAAGVSATLATALSVVRPAGWIAKVGWGEEPLGFSLDPLVQKNIRLQGSFSHNWPVWERVVRLLASGMLDVEPILGGTWPLAEWREAFEAMHSGRIVKAVLTPCASS